VDGHSIAAVDAAIIAAKAQTAKPTLICCQTIIGRGAPHKAGSAQCHGAPLGAEEVGATRAALRWTHAPFDIPEAVYAAWDARPAGTVRQGAWEALMARYRKKYPKLAADYTRRLRGDLPASLAPRCARQLREIQAKSAALATRQASQKAIAFLAGLLPELVGGSADLSASNLTLWPAAKIKSNATNGGNYVHYGVREFGMAAIINGMLLHGALRPFGGTFLTFSDYARNALRMAALMRLNAIYVFTHDSIGLGEDGPTHQPVEQTASFRLIPNMDVWRPCDAAETLVAWQAALEHRHTPTCLILSRQSLPAQARSAQQLNDMRKGAYALRQEAGPLQAVLIATGSEVALAVEAWATLAEQGVHVRVVSMPSCHAFDRQDQSYQHALLPLGVPAVAIEAGVTAGWRKYVGRRGAVIGIDTFGESAPAAELYRHFGITAARVVETTLKLLPN
jgi:transketolase